jgi:hypothetical protein
MLQAFFDLHTELLFFVDTSKPRSLELHVFRNQSMRSNDHIDTALLSGVPECDFAQPFDR